MHYRCAMGKVTGLTSLFALVMSRHTVQKYSVITGKQFVSSLQGVKCISWLRLWGKENISSKVEYFVCLSATSQQDLQTDI